MRYPATGLRPRNNLTVVITSDNGPRWLLKCAIIKEVVSEKATSEKQLN